MAISTLILLILGILILIGLAYVLTGGFVKFQGTTQPFIDTSTASAVKQGCSLACTIVIGLRGVVRIIRLMDRR